MKNVSLICGLTLLTAVAASGCEYADYQTIAASRQATQASDVPATKDTETDVILPSGDTTPAPEVPVAEAPETQPVPVQDVCVPETDAEFCSRLAKDCNAVTAADNCGTVRTAECGSCKPGFTCGGETQNVCSSVTAPYCYTYDFVSTRDGYENIYAASTCSKEEPTQVTRNTREENRFRNLQISNDGKKATYDYFFAGASDWMMSIDDVTTLGVGGENISGCRSAALSPSNDRVVYVCESGLFFTDRQDLSQTRLIFSDNSDTRVFEKAVWSPVKTETDASYGKVVFSAKEADGSDKLYVYDDKTTRKTRFLYEQYNGDGHDVVLKGSSADISPDGKTLAFVRKNAMSGQEQVWACDLMFDQVFVPQNSLSPASSHVPTVTKESLCVNPRMLTSEGNNAGPHWTSNGKHLFFSSDRDGNKEVYVMKADGTDQSNLTQDPASDRDSDVFPVKRFGADLGAVDAVAAEAGL